MCARAVGYCKNQLTAAGSLDESCDVEQKVTNCAMVLEVRTVLLQGEVESWARSHRVTSGMFGSCPFTWVVGTKVVFGGN